jgi:hypothetical protein
MVKQDARVPSIPRAARATPYIPARRCETATDKPIRTVGTMQDMYPRASPKMMPVAADVF